MDHLSTIDTEKKRDVTTKKKEMLSARSVAELFDASERTIWRWVSAGKIIAPLHIGDGTTRWRAKDLHEWIEAGCPTPTH